MSTVNASERVPSSPALSTDPKISSSHQVSVRRGPRTATWTLRWEPPPRKAQPSGRLCCTMPHLLGPPVSSAAEWTLIPCCRVSCQVCPRRPPRHKQAQSRSRGAPNVPGSNPQPVGDRDLWMCPSRPCPPLWKILQKF